MLELAVTIILGIAGGLIALRLKIPAGAMIGAMFTIAVYNVMTGCANIPPNTKILTQVAAGTFIGAGIKYEDVLSLKQILKPAILFISGIMVLSMIMGFVTHKLTGMDLVTSLFASAPGGVVDMSLISQDMGGDSSKVAVLQLVRLMSVIGFFPFIIRFFTSRIKGNKDAETLKYPNSVSDDGGSQTSKSVSPGTSFKEKLKMLVFTLSVGLISGLCGFLLGIPAGALTLSMIAVAVFSILTGKGYMPLSLRRLTQMFAGMLIGARVSMKDLISLKAVILPALIIIAGFIVINFCLGYIISRASGLDITTSLFASAPGGVSDMALIAGELGADTAKIAILQLVRVICVVATYPVLIKLIVLFCN